MWLRPGLSHVSVRVTVPVWGHVPQLSLTSLNEQTINKRIEFDKCGTRSKFREMPEYIPCDIVDCELCTTINAEANVGWCFEWLRQLKDFEESQDLAEKERQVLLMVDHTDNEVRHIRSKLARLQTQTVNCNTRFKLVPLFLCEILYSFCCDSLSLPGK